MPSENPDHLDPEKVAYWYFRLNGFFQMESFIVHPPGKGGQRTDADLVGVRFPHRAERHFDDSDHVMGDDKDTLSLSDHTIDVAIVEVKTNMPCSLNGPRSNPERGNLQRVLAAIGCVPLEEVENVAEAVYRTGEFVDQASTKRVRLIALGRDLNADLEESHPAVAQVTWKQALTFIGNRFYEFRTQKKDVKQWDEPGKLLHSLTDTHTSHGEFDLDQFLTSATAHMGIREE